jgi:hypothetical protein
MQEEINSAGFSVINTLPVEGPMWFINDFEKRWNDKKRRNELIELLNFLENEKQSLLLTLHYIVVAEK